MTILDLTEFMTVTNSHLYIEKLAIQAAVVRQGSLDASLFITHVQLPNMHPYNRLSKQKPLSFRPGDLVQPRTLNATGQRLTWTGSWTLTCSI